MEATKHTNTIKHAILPIDESIISTVQTNLIYRPECGNNGKLLKTDRTESQTRRKLNI